MKISAFNGSPKGKNSNTNVMVEAFLAFPLPINKKGICDGKE